MKKTPPPLDFGRPWLTSGVSHVSVRQQILQSLLSRWNRILVLISSNFFSRDWTLGWRMLGRGGRCALPLSLCQTPLCFPLCFLIRFPGDSSPLLWCVVVARSYYLHRPLRIDVESIQEPLLSTKVNVQQCICLYVVSADILVQTTHNLCRATMTAIRHGCAIFELCYKVTEQIYLLGQVWQDVADSNSGC